MTVQILKRFVASWSECVKCHKPMKLHVRVKGTRGRLCPSCNWCGVTRDAHARFCDPGAMCMRCALPIAKCECVKLTPNWKVYGRMVFLVLWAIGWTAAFIFIGPYYEAWPEWVVLGVRVSGIGLHVYLAVIGIRDALHELEFNAWYSAERAKAGVGTT